MQPRRDDQAQRAQNYIRTRILVTYKLVSGRLVLVTKGWNAERVDAAVKTSSFTAQTIKPDGKAGVSKIALSKVGERLADPTKNLMFVKSYRPAEFYTPEVFNAALRRVKVDIGDTNGEKLLTAFRNVDPDGFDAMIATNPEIEVRVAGPIPDHAQHTDSYLMKLLGWTGIITGGSSAITNDAIRGALAFHFLSLFGISKNNYGERSGVITGAIGEKAKGKTLDLIPLNVSVHDFLFLSANTNSTSAVWVDASGIRIGSSVEVTKATEIKFKQMVDELLAEHHRNKVTTLADDDTGVKRIDITYLLQKGTAVEKTYTTSSNYIPLNGFGYQLHSDPTIKSIPRGFFVCKMIIKEASVIGGERAVRAMRRILTPDAETAEKQVLDAYAKEAASAMLAKIGCKAKGGAKKEKKGIDMTGRSRATAATTTTATPFTAVQPSSSIFGGAAAPGTAFGAVNPFAPTTTTTVAPPATGATINPFSFS